MTNNEAIEILKGAIKKPNTKDGYLGQALTMGIEALENQKSIIEELEKIKTKINYDGEHFKYDSDHYAIDLWEVNNIIDKRISELKGDNNG